MPGGDDGILPLQAPQHIAVIGRAAKEAHFQGGGSSHINPTAVDVPFTELQKLAANAEFSYAAGYPEDDSRNQGLIDEAVGLAQKADVALLYRMPGEDERRLFRAADGDTAIVVPVALGGIALLAPLTGDTTAIALPELDAFLAGRPSTLRPPLYATDPNDGLWQAFRGDPQPSATAPVVLLADAGAVLAAARDGGGALGLASTLTLPADLAAAGVHAMSVAAHADSAPAAPTLENLAAGRYPLRHRLYAACRATGGIEAAKFLTHLAGGRGQRHPGGADLPGAGAGLAPLSRDGRR